MQFFPNFLTATTKLKHQLREFGSDVHTETWQGLDIANKPDMRMRELTFQSLQVPLPASIDELRADVPANYPWAEDHFLERVSGYPMNPGTQWAKWPWGNSAKNFLDAAGKFNHNYMERFWPRFAGGVKVATDSADDWRAKFRHDTRESGEAPKPNRGIAYDYGDLQDVVNLLAREPFTRQAFMPVWFPEDTGAVHGDRAPCTLGYHFMQRKGKLHIVYYIRSCDLVRHFSDDCYLTARMVYWMLDKLRADPAWSDVTPGVFMMHISSLHCFANDVRSL